MPLYEFRCRSCGERFEQLVRGEDRNQPVVCPRCQAAETERVFSAFARMGARTCDPLPAGGG